MNALLHITIAIAMAATLIACDKVSSTASIPVQGPTPTSIGSSATPTEPIPPLTRLGPEIQGATISELLSLTKDQVSWRNSDGAEKLLELQTVEKTFSDAPEGKTSKTSLDEFSNPDISPSGRFIAFMVLTFAGGTAWHLGLATAEGTALGLYSAPTNPRCYIHDFVWRPDDKGVVVEPAGCGGIGRLVLLDQNARVVYDVTTRGIKGILYISPDSQWVALDDGPAWEENRRIEFILLEDPDIRLDLPVSGIPRLNEWLEGEWLRGWTGAK